MRRVVLAALLIAAACREKSAETMNPVVPPQRDLPANRVPAATKAQARLELQEFEIRMPETLKAGHQSFLVVNSGKENHSLIVDGNGTHVELPQQLPRGDSAPLELDLKPGTYTFYCPVDEHKGKGMTRTVTVQ